MDSSCFTKNQSIPEISIFVVWGATDIVQGLLYTLSTERKLTEHNIMIATTAKYFLPFDDLMFFKII